jgi:hypothetical protein
MDAKPVDAAAAVAKNPSRAVNVERGWRIRA